MKKKIVYLSSRLVNTINIEVDTRNYISFYYKTIKTFIIEEGLAKLNSNSKDNKALEHKVNLVLTNTCSSLLAIKEVREASRANVTDL